MSVGAKWECLYTQVAGNNKATENPIHNKRRVVGWEDVTVPAGTFRALRLESEATVKIPTRVSDQKGGEQMMVRVGGATATTWYVPEVKRLVKHIDENVNENKVLVRRIVTELTEYKVQ